MATHSTHRFLLAVAIAALALVAPIAGVAGEDASFASVTTDELFGRARDAFAQHDFEIAEICYEEILRRDRTNLQAILELSTVYERSGKLEYARGLLIRATRIDPDYPAIEQRRKSVDDLLARVLTTEVDSLLARGDYETAIPKLSLHNSIDPGNATVHYKRALCLFETGRLEAALTDIEVAIAASPQEAYFVLRDRIRGESQRSEVDRLEAQVSRLAKSDHPRNRDQALQLLGRILEIDPDHKWARTEFIRLSEAGTQGQADTTAVADAEPGALAVARDAVWSAVNALGALLGRHASAVLFLVVAFLIFRSPLTKVLSSRLSRGPLLAGELSSFSVAEVLTMLNAQAHTGVVTVKASNCRGKVYIEGGEPCHCTSGGREGVEALMALVDNAHKGRFAFVEGSIPLQRTIDTPLSILLVEQAHKRNGVAVRPGVVGRKSKMKELLDSKLEV